MEAETIVCSSPANGRTVKLRATHTFWDPCVGCGDKAYQHVPGDLVEVPIDHARHLIAKGGYVIAEDD
jgi:hypothetical protein